MQSSELFDIVIITPQGVLYPISIQKAVSILKSKLDKA